MEKQEEKFVYYDSKNFTTDLKQVAGDRYEKLKDVDQPIRFFESQPFDEMHNLFLEMSAKIKEATGVDRIYQVGSSSIKGMPGMFGVDMIALAPVWPLPESFSTTMDALGFRNAGNSTHAGEDGVWFLKREDAHIIVDGTQHSCGTVFHVVRKDSGILLNFLAFREYCRRTEIGFQKYRELKLSLLRMEGQSKLAYKLQKNMCLEELKSNAKVWFAQEGLNLESFTE